jgi:hypothetical protein
MRRTHLLNGLVTLACMAATMGLAAGCSPQGTAGDLPDSIGPVTSAEDSAALAKKLEQQKGKGYRGAPGAPYGPRR